MSHRTAVPQVRFPDLTKMEDAELRTELHYLYWHGINEKMLIIRHFTDWALSDILLEAMPIPDAVRTVPAWKHVEDLQMMVERMQAIKEELEYRRI